MDRTTGLRPISFARLGPFIIRKKFNSINFVS